MVLHPSARAHVYMYMYMYMCVCVLIGKVDAYMYVYVPYNRGDCTMLSENLLPILRSTLSLWERVNGVPVGTYGRFDLAGLFTSMLQKKAKRRQYYRQ